VAAEEERHREAKKEAQEELTREAQDHDEREQDSLGAADGVFPEVSPVDLRLLARCVPASVWRRRVVGSDPPRPPGFVALGTPTRGYGNRVTARPSCR
jgi:hypothetical protein